MYPSCDPWGKPFSKAYCKKRFEMSGQRIAGPYVGCLDGILGDQDYIKTILSPARFLDKCSVFRKFTKCFWVQKRLRSKVHLLAKSAASIAMRGHGCTWTRTQNWPTSCTPVSAEMLATEPRVQPKNGKRVRDSPRLVAAEEWISENPSPLTGIVGFSPWRGLALQMKTQSV